MPTKHSYVVKPVTKSRWNDLLELFGENGAYSNCWCMFFRLKSSEFDEGIRGQNRKKLKELVDSNKVPGLLAYENGRPVGWCSVAAREQFGRVERSPLLKPVDEEPAYSIVCFYIDRSHRRAGVGSALLEGAVEYARKKGARWLEAYPIDTDEKPDHGAAALFTGPLSMFERAGFEEIDRRSPARPIVRKELR